MNKLNTSMPVTSKEIINTTINPIVNLDELRRVLIPDDVKAKMSEPSDNEKKKASGLMYYLRCFKTPEDQHLSKRSK